MIRVEKLSKAAEMELYKDSLKHDYLVVSGGLLLGRSQYLKIRMFVEIIRSLKNCLHARDIANVWEIKKTVGWCNQIKCLTISVK